MIINENVSNRNNFILFFLFVYNDHWMEPVRSGWNGQGAKKKWMLLRTAKQCPIGLYICIDTETWSNRISLNIAQEKFRKCKTNLFLFLWYAWMGKKKRAFFFRVRLLIECNLFSTFFCSPFTRIRPMCFFFHSVTRLAFFGICLF